MDRDSRERKPAREISVYVTQYPLSWKQKDLFDLFNRKVRGVDRVDMKDKFAFVLFKNDADAEDAVRIMDGHETSNRPLRVEIAKGEQKKAGRGLDVKTRVLFVVNFDKEETTERDIRDFFSGFDIEEIEMWRGGKGIANKNFCFVTMRDERTAADAKDTLDGRYMGDRQITVEFKSGGENSKRGGGRDRDRDRDRRESRYAPYPSGSRRRDSRERRRDDFRRSDRDEVRGGGRDDRRDSRDRRPSYRDEPRRREDRDRDFDRRGGRDRFRSRSRSY